MKITIFSPSGVILEGKRLTLAVRRLRAQGLEVALDESVRARDQRFAGDDAVRLAAIARAAADDADVALAARGGYGLTRLLDGIDWRGVAASVERGKRWVGHSDFTAFELALLAHTGASSWAGPMALSDFGREKADADGEPAVDEITNDCFLEAMRGELEAIGFRTGNGFDGLEANGLLWGGNLTMVCSLLGTAHWPRIKGGILFLEDVNEPPYRVERMLLQLLQAGVLAEQKAVLLGDFGRWKPTASDRGYRLSTAIDHVRSVCPVPILAGLPFGHVPTKLTLPVGVRAELAVDGRNAMLGWAHAHNHEHEHTHGLDDHSGHSH